MTAALLELLVVAAIGIPGGFAIGRVILRLSKIEPRTDRRR